MVARSKDSVVVVPHSVVAAIDQLQQDYDLGFYNRPELEAMVADDATLLPAVREVLDVVSIDEFVAPGITIWVEEPEEDYSGKVWVRGKLKERNVPSWDHAHDLQIELLVKRLGPRGIYKVGLYLV